NQQASFEPIVKWAARSERIDQLPDLIAEAWRRALTPPSGPTYLEVPVDLLLAEAAALLSAAERPVIWAGGGVLRSGGWEALVQLAERIDAPVATTYMGKG